VTVTDEDKALAQRLRDFVIAEDIDLAADRIEALRAEVERLNRLINSTGDHWLALVAVHPVQWEGAIDAAMEAACNEIKRLAALGAKP